MTSVDVVTAAWTAAGQPRRADAIGAAVASCARCAASAELVPTRRVVSKVFTAFDGWTEPSGTGLCPPCCWAYTHPDLRLLPHLVSQQPTLASLALTETYALLAAGPLEPERALTVPLRPGRKHLLPASRWGQVTLDDVAVAWRLSDSLGLRTVARLRSLGFGTRMLSEPAPAWSVLRRHPRVEWRQISADWARLQRWRPRSPWLSLALHLTLKEPR